MNQQVRLRKMIDGKGRRDQVAVWDGSDTLAGSEGLTIGQDGRLRNLSKPVVTEAPQDGKTYGRRNAGWTEVNGDGATTVIGGGDGEGGGGEGGTGPQGPPGPAGPMGPTGPTGPQGPSGADSTVPGPQGPQGIQGNSGPTGPAGPQGIDGADGADGATGPAGPSTYAIVSDTPPVGAPDNSLWWESDTGLLWLRYNDGTSTQWVIACPQADASYVRHDVAQSLTTTQQTQARSNIGVPGSNVVINGDFRINQVGYVSGAALSAGVYGHDQWKAGASGGNYSFTQLTSSTQITIASGKSLIQPIENVNVVGGSYVLTWTGTAQARCGVNTLTPSGAYAGSPLLIVGQTAGTVMSVEFNSGTLGTVKLESGANATPFIMRPFDQELLTCQRYWSKRPGYVSEAGVNTGGTIRTTIHHGPMRVAPTATLIVPESSSSNVSGITYFSSGSNINATEVYASAIVAGQASFLAMTTLDARL